MIIELDRNVFSGGEDFIEWNSLPSQPLKDGFTFSRRVNLSKLYELYPQHVYPLKLLFHFKQDPPLYEINNVYLKRLIRTTEEYSRSLKLESQSGGSNNSLQEETFTLNQILSMIWEYITKNRLYDSEDKSLIRCDELLSHMMTLHETTTMNNNNSTNGIPPPSIP